MTCATVASGYSDIAGDCKVVVPTIEEGRTPTSSTAVSSEAIHAIIACCTAADGQIGVCVSARGNNTRAAAATAAAAGCSSCASKTASRAIICSSGSTWRVYGTTSAKVAGRDAVYQTCCSIITRI